MVGETVFNLRLIICRPMKALDKHAGVNTKRGIVIYLYSLVLIQSVYVIVVDIVGGLDILRRRGRWRGRRGRHALGPRRPWFVKHIQRLRPNPRPLCGGIGTHQYKPD